MKLEVVGAVGVLELVVEAGIELYHAATDVVLDLVATCYIARSCDSPVDRGLDEELESLGLADIEDEVEAGL